MGTAVGTSVFNSHGWRAAAALNLAWEGFCLAVLLSRGPHCSRYTWFGWEGGFGWRKNVEQPDETQEQVAGSEQQLNEKDPEAGIAEKAGEKSKEPEKLERELRSSTEKKRVEESRMNES